MKRITSFLHTGKYSTIILVQGKKGKRKWIERNQHRSRLARSSLRTNPLEKGTNHSCQVGSTPSCVLFSCKVSCLTAFIYPLLLLVSPSALAPSMPADCCRQGFRAATHRAPVGDRGAWGSLSEREKRGGALTWSPRPVSTCSTRADRRAV